MDEVISPAQKTLEAHLNTVRFQCAVEEGRWSVLFYAFPQLYVRVNGKGMESGTTLTHDFHLECENYPATTPFVERWAYSDNPQHGHKPPAPSEGSPGYVDAMKDWGNLKGIYRGWQREAASHNDWAQKMPEQAWHKDREITFIMENLYALVSEQAAWLASRAA